MSYPIVSKEEKLCDKNQDGKGRENYVLQRLRVIYKFMYLRPLFSQIRQRCQYYQQIQEISNNSLQPLIDLIHQSPIC